MNENILTYCEMWESESIVVILDLAVKNQDIEKTKANEYIKRYFEMVSKDEDTSGFVLEVLDSIGVTESVFDEYIENKEE